MQADYETKYNDIRESQYVEIKDSLIYPNENIEIPIILFGDLNMSKPSELKLMLDKINFVNGPLIGKLKHSYLGDENYDAELLDYILIKSNHFKFKEIECKIQDMSIHLKIDPMQLSDHHPIEGIFQW